MCEFQNMYQEYQERLIGKLWKTVYILAALCVILALLFAGLAVWGIRYFQSFDYIEETRYSYEIDGVDIANINQQGGVFNGQSGSNSSEKES